MASTYNTSEPGPFGFQSQRSGESNIAILYSREYIDKISNLKDGLKREGFNVWMDTSEAVDVMANAVEMADIVLVCYSESFYKSHSCRTGAEYAYKMKKTIIPVKMQQNYEQVGWLGILIGTKLYFDFTTNDAMQRNFSELVREIRRLGKKGTGTPTLTKVTTKTTKPDNRPRAKIDKRIVYSLWGTFLY